MKKTEFIVLGLLVTLIVFLGFVQFVRADEKKYFVYLPFVAQKADLKPRIEITYVPPYGISRYDDVEKRFFRGRVLNVNPSESQIIVYLYVWEGEGPPLESWESWLPSCSDYLMNHDGPNYDGSFGSFLSGSDLSSRYLRFYLTDKNYCPPNAYYPSPPFTRPGIVRGKELPPDPPTPEVWAMVEVKRTPEGWKIIQRKP